MGSSLFRKLSREELEKVVSSGLGGKFLSAELMSGGLFNTTYLVETEDFGKTVLRAGPVNRNLLMPFERRLMEAEKEVYRLCAENGIPASEILACDTTKTILDRDFMFVRYIPGKPMSETALSLADRERICKDIGAATAKMHGIKAEKFGRIVDVASGGGFSRWSDFLLDEYNNWKSIGIPSELFNESELSEIGQIFRRAVPFLDEIKEPRLVHTDLWLGNILIYDRGESPRFAAIIDADRAIWGDPAFEFSSIRWTYGERSFWKGYGAELSDKASDVVRRSVYTILNNLWNSYVYLCEYNQPREAERACYEAKTEISVLNMIL